MKKNMTDLKFDAVLRKELEELPESTLKKLIVAMIARLDFQLIIPLAVAVIRRNECDGRLRGWTWPEDFAPAIHKSGR